MHRRHLARDYETHPHRSEAMIHLAMIDLMARRLTNESTPNWRKHLIPETDMSTGTKRSMTVPLTVAAGCLSSWVA
ncbi:hypothetical protein GCM10018779_59610 [Streptomyces griseocarneus]|nr:hypothetical protein GCM10018779_59610 [Streptomyces griseocarneus]